MLLEQNLKSVYRHLVRITDFLYGMILLCTTRTQFYYQNYNLNGKMKSVFDSVYYMLQFLCESNFSTCMQYCREMNETHMHAS